VRLITLASWSFVSDPAGNDTFGKLMLGLRQNAAVFGVALPAPASDDHINQALSHGYVPVSYQPLESTQTFAWYRGPLAVSRAARAAGQRAVEATALPTRRRRADL
jgi:hypothetical protein